MVNKNINKKNFLKDLYKRISLIRKSEIAIQEHYLENEMKTPMHMSMGEESAVVGVVTAVEGGAQFFGYYRSHALFLAVSQDVESFFAEMYGKKTGSARGRAGSMHMAYPEKKFLLASAIVSSTIAPAVGAAFANKYRGSSEIAVCFFGDGAMEEGVFWESINMASVLKLPVMFVCLDNGLAVDSPAYTRQGFRSIKEIVDAFGIIYGEDESSNPVEIHTLAKNIRSLMLKNNTPGFLRLKYYRQLQHIGIYSDFDELDNNSEFENKNYRTLLEKELWAAKDPMLVMEGILENNEFSKEELEKIKTEVDISIRAAVSHAKNDEFPCSSELKQHVFC